jgi:hypothetical protein
MGFDDFLEANITCYRPYSGADKHNYSSYFYANHAVGLIKSLERPWFIQMAMQAGRTPFDDPYIDDGAADLNDLLMTQDRADLVASVSVLLPNTQPTHTS